MGRNKKHPEHKARAEILMNSLLDEVVSLWTSEDRPELKSIAAEVEISASKLRKLLITAGERDHISYFTSDTADTIFSLYHNKATIKEIMESTGLSYSSVQGYLPHKSVYNLDTMSAECERIRLYRKRKAAVGELHAHLDLPDASVYLWKAVILFEGYPFSTAGRGKDKTGAVKFKYTVSRSGGAGGRHYDGENVEGYGNEIFITSGGEQLKKSISTIMPWLVRIEQAIIKDLLIDKEQDEMLQVPLSCSRTKPLHLRIPMIFWQRSNCFLEMIGVW